jgi:hypothetical protein
VLVGCDAIVRKPQWPGQPALAILDRLPPDVLPVYLEQVERKENRPRIGAMTANEIEHSKSIVAPKRRRSSRVTDIAEKISSAAAESSRDYLQLCHFNDLHGDVGGDGRRI